ncbi:MAG: RdgB/HAM1 family non-canonical purine NTP pyrophosphatase [Nitrospirota bacterium]
MLATTNAGKVREITALLSGLDWEFVSQRDVGVLTGVEEDGLTYEANALKKAVPLARRLQLPVLADDSGLEVDALGGAPGVLSARYAGLGATDVDNRRLLLARLRDVPPDRRTGRFRCVIALAAPSGAVRVFAGSVEGRIRDTEAGVRGFGYDPVFELPERDLTFAELSDAEKNRVSHRARALVAVRDMLSTDAAWLEACL